MLKVLQNSGRNQEASDKFQNIMTKITKQFDKKKARRLKTKIISDTGGPLSHSAIVAREYNIPAVLGIGNATDLLEDEDEVFVDGSCGKVIILK